jgi:Beta-lactamase enzyme family
MASRPIQRTRSEVVPGCKHARPDGGLPARSDLGATLAMRRIAGGVTAIIFLVVATALSSPLAGAHLAGAVSRSAVRDHANPDRHRAELIAQTTGGTSAGPLRLGPDPFDGEASSYLETRGGRVTAGLFDINDHTTWLLHGTTTQATGSIVKVDILAALVEQAKIDRAPFTAKDEQLASRMIEYSDNDAATTLWNRAGGPVGIGAVNRRLHLSNTELSTCVQCPGFPWPGWGLTTTSATDQLALLRSIVLRRSPLSPGDRRYIQGLMEHVTPSERWGISAGVPSDVTVALKDGWLPLNDSDTDWQVNSVGWVHGRGRDYLLVVLTTGNPTEQYGIDTIDGLAQILWSKLGP